MSAGRDDQRLPKLLLGLVIASAALLILAALVPQTPGAAASPHPEHPSLLSGADAPSHWMLGIGWAFGALQVAFFGACFALGMQRGGRLGPIARPLWLGLGLYEALWAALVISYAATAGDPAARLWGSFPAPTAWMLYGLWPFPLFFALLYLFHFDGWFLNTRDLQRFRARVAELEGRTGGDDGGGSPAP